MVDVRQKAVNGVIWSTLAEIVAKVIQPLSFLILTRLLSPSDFGVVAVATTILSFVYIICDLGTSKVLVQIKCEPLEFEKYCDSSFWFNLIVGLLLFSIVFGLSSYFASFYGQPQSTMVVKVMAIQILTYSLSTVQTAIRNRKIDFKFLFKVRLITIASPLFISIPIAFLGGGYWAIVIGTVAGSALNTLVLWVSSEWKPKFRFYWGGFKEIISKSIWSSLEHLIMWIPICLDTYLISNYMSSKDLGLYTTSRSLFTSASGLTLKPIMPVLFTSLSRIEDFGTFKIMMMKAQKHIFTFAIIIGVIVFAFSAEITAIIFGSKWVGIEKLIDVVFIFMSFEYFYSAILEGLRANGYFREVSINAIMSTLLTVPILFWGANSENIIIYTLCRTISLYIFYFGAFYYSSKRLGVSFGDCVNNNRTTLITTFFAVSLIWAIKILEINYSLVGIFVVISIYFILLYKNEKQLFANVISIVKNKLYYKPTK